MNWRRHSVLNESLLLISSSAHTPAVHRIVPFHNQGVKGQDIITPSFLLVSWKSHLCPRGNSEGNGTFFCLEIVPQWHKIVKNSPLPLICWVLQWLLFRGCEIGLKTFCPHLKLNTLGTLFCFVLFFFLDARVGDWIGESLKGFCGSVHCGFLVVYPCGEDHTVSLRRMPHFHIINDTSLSANFQRRLESQTHRLSL